jgi:cell division cycle 14
LGNKADIESNGDLNLLGPFIPFASPIEDAWRRAMQPRWEAIAQAEKTGEPLPPMRTLAKGRLAGNQAFRNVLDVFGKQNVGLVVRLNDEL